jgi:hypothetical protein
MFLASRICVKSKFSLQLNTFKSNIVETCFTTDVIIRIVSFLKSTNSFIAG